MTVKELNSKTSRINIEVMKLDAVRRQLGYIAEVNRLQLRKGKTGTFAGQNISPTYKKGYGKYKKTLSTYYAPGGTPDLFLSGSFQNKIRAFLIGTEFKLISDDSKNLKLTEKYGEEIFGINTKHLPLVTSKVTRQLGQLFKQATGL
jgi:hypothetical protein